MIVVPLIHFNFNRDIPSSNKMFKHQVETQLANPLKASQTLANKNIK